MFILGISAYYHDSAACIIDDKKIIAAVQEERFSRIKHDKSFPVKSIIYCLSKANIEFKDLSHIVFYDKPLVKFERLIETYLSFAPKGFSSFAASMPIWLKDKLFQKYTIIRQLKENFKNIKDIERKLFFSEHHLSHMGSAFYPSPFESSAILTMDGVGEWATTSYGVGTNNKIEILNEIYFPHSLGLLYSAFTYYLGFKVNSGEYKVMGLAPFGQPIYSDTIKDNLIDIKNDGSYRLNLDYFDYCVGLKMTNKKFNKLFNAPERSPENQITQKEMDIAASIQKVCEEIVIKLAKKVKEETNNKNLCLAGGVALNSVANGKLLKEKIFENIWIQPAAGDAGGSLGAALCIKHLMLNKKRKFSFRSPDMMQGANLGPEFSEEEIKSTLIKLNANFKQIDKKLLFQKVASDLDNQKIVGWMNGRMEFGPRALGSRSILADARSPEMQKKLNLKIKYRESFRPFAPAVLKEDVKEWFEIEDETPYMLLVANVRKDKRIKYKDNNVNGLEKIKIKNSQIPSVTHVDNSARIQTVDSNSNQDFHNLIKEFKNITNCPVLINTSFNIRGEPIVCTPEDAYRCFIGTDMDILVINNFYLKKEEQENMPSNDYKNSFDLD